MSGKRNQVFINCPFDADYLPLFHSLIYTISFCGFVPRCALEVMDSGGTRIAKIEQIIEECRFGIHDISRTELDPVNHLPRFNMPLELGLFLGARRFGDEQQRQKICMVLDRDRFRYQKFLSDIAGHDIESHEGSPRRAVDKVRNFLNSSRRTRMLPSGEHIWLRYTEFRKNLPQICDELRINADDIAYGDYLWVVARHVGGA